MAQQVHRFGCWGGWCFESRFPQAVSCPRSWLCSLLAIRCIFHHPWTSLKPHHVMQVQQMLSVIINQNLAVVVAVIWLWNVFQSQNVKGSVPWVVLLGGGWRLKAGMPSRRFLGLIIFVVLFCFFEERCCSVTMADVVLAQAGLELRTVVMPQPPKHWDYKSSMPQPAF